MPFFSKKRGGRRTQGYKSIGKSTGFSRSARRLARKRIVPMGKGAFLFR